MPEHWLDSSAAAGGNGTQATPWNTYTAADNGLAAAYPGAGSAAGVILNVRGYFTTLRFHDISGTAISPFIVRTDPGAPQKAEVNGEYVNPTGQSFTFNWWRSGSPTGPLAGGGSMGVIWYGIFRFVNCQHVKVQNFIVRNSTTTGISGLDLDGMVEDTLIENTLQYPLAGGDFSAKRCVLRNFSMCNYRGAQSVVFPVIGGILLAGQNGSTNKTLTTLTLTTNRLLEDCDIYNSGGEGINAFSADGVTIRNCRIYNNFTVSLYLHNVKDVLAENNIIYVDPTTWLFDYPNYTVMPAADLVYPGFATSLFNWVSNPQPGGYAIADPHLSGGPRQVGSGIVIGEEFPQVKAGENVTIRNNMLYKTGIREYAVNAYAGGWTTPWSTTTNLRQDNLRIEHNTIVDAPSDGGINLNGTLVHPGALIRNNVFQQSSGLAAPAWNTSEVTGGGNVFALNPGGSFVSANDIVGDPKLTRGSSVNRTFFLPLAGSVAINRGVTIADNTIDPDGVARDSSPTSGAMEYVAPADASVTDSIRLTASKWFVYFEGDDTLTDLAVQSIELAGAVDGADITTGRTISSSGAVTNAANAFDGNAATAATATGACVFQVTYSTPQTIEEVRIKYPTSIVSGSTGPVRIAVAIEHPVTLREVFMKESIGITPVADAVVKLSVNTRLGQMRGFRRRALSAIHTNHT